MADLISIEISDLTEDGVRHFLEVALQKKIRNFEDWETFGPLIEQFQIELSHHVADTNKDARSILGYEIEPWTASVESLRGLPSQDGRSPQVAIAKVIVDRSMPGEEIAVSRSAVVSMLKHPDHH